MNGQQTDEFGGVAVAQDKDEFGGVAVKEPTAPLPDVSTPLALRDPYGYMKTQPGYAGMETLGPPSSEFLGAIAPDVSPEGIGRTVKAVPGQALRAVEAVPRVLGTVVSGLGRSLRDVVDPMTFMPEEQQLAYRKVPFKITGFGGVRPGEPEAEIRPLTREEREPLQAGKPLFQPRMTALDPYGSDFQRIASQWSTPEGITMLAAGNASKLFGYAILASMLPGVVEDITKVARSDTPDEQKRDAINNMVLLALLGLRHKVTRGRGEPDYSQELPPLEFTGAALPGLPKGAPPGPRPTAGTELLGPPTPPVTPTVPGSPAEPMRGVSMVEEARQAGANTINKVLALFPALEGNREAARPIRDAAFPGEEEPPEAPPTAPPGPPLPPAPPAPPAAGPELRVPLEEQERISMRDEAEARRREEARQSELRRGGIEQQIVTWERELNKAEQASDEIGKRRAIQRLMELRRELEGPQPPVKPPILPKPPLPGVPGSAIGVEVPETAAEALRNVPMIEEARRAGADTINKVLTLFPALEGNRERARAIRDRAFPEKKGAPDATREGKQPGGIPPERPRDDEGGPPPEAGPGGGIPPTAPKPPETPPAPQAPAVTPPKEEPPPAPPSAPPPEPPPTPPTPPKARPTEGEQQKMVDRINAIISEQVKLDSELYKIRNTKKPTKAQLKRAEEIRAAQDALKAERAQLEEDVKPTQSELDAVIGTDGLAQAISLEPNVDEWRPIDSFHYLLLRDYRKRQISGDLEPRWDRLSVWTEIGPSGKEVKIISRPWSATSPNQMSIDLRGETISETGYRSWMPQAVPQVSLREATKQFIAEREAEVAKEREKAERKAKRGKKPAAPAPTPPPAPAPEAPKAEGHPLDALLPDIGDKVPTDKGTVNPDGTWVSPWITKKQHQRLEVLADKAGWVGQAIVEERKGKGIKVEYRPKLSEQERAIAQSKARIARLEAIKEMDPNKTAAVDAEIAKEQAKLDALQKPAAPEVKPPDVTSADTVPVPKTNRFGSNPPWVSELPERVQPLSKGPLKGKDLVAQLWAEYQATGNPEIRNLLGPGRDMLLSIKDILSDINDYPSKLKKAVESVQKGVKPAEVTPPTPPVTKPDPVAQIEAQRRAESLERINQAIAATTDGPTGDTAIKIIEDSPYLTDAERNDLIRKATQAKWDAVRKFNRDSAFYGEREPVIQALAKQMGLGEGRQIHETGVGYLYMTDAIKRAALNKFIIAAEKAGWEFRHDVKVDPMYGRGLFQGIFQPKKGSPVADPIDPLGKAKPAAPPTSAALDKLKAGIKKRETLSAKEAVDAAQRRFEEASKKLAARRLTYIIGEPREKFKGSPKAKYMQEYWDALDALDEAKKKAGITEPPPEPPAPSGTPVPKPTPPPAPAAPAAEPAPSIGDTPEIVAMRKTIADAQEALDAKKAQLEGLRKAAIGMIIDSKEWKENHAKGRELLNTIEADEKYVRRLIDKLTDARIEQAFAPFRGKPVPPPGKQKITTKILKAQREDLLDQVAAAIKEAPEAGEGKITFSIPGDGDWTIDNTKAGLKKFQALVQKEFPKAVGGPGGPTIPSGEATAMPAAEEPTATKDKTLAEVLGKIAGAFVSTDKNRYAILTAYADGQQIVATDGRRMIRIVSDEAPGTLAKPVRIDEKGKVVESESDFPNFQQIYSDKPDLVMGGAPTDQLWLVAKQATKLFIGADKEKNPATVRIFMNRDGTIGAEAKNLGDEYSHNVQPGALGLGKYNAEYLLDAADAARRMGNERVDLYFHGDEGPLEMRGKKVSILTMPMRDTEGTGAASMGRDTRFPASTAEHGTLPKGYGPLRSAEGALREFTDVPGVGKFSVTLAQGKFTIERHHPSTKTAYGMMTQERWDTIGTVEREHWQKSGDTFRSEMIASAIKPDFEASKVPQSLIKALDKAMRTTAQEREKIIREGEERAKAEKPLKLVDKLDKLAADAIKRIQDRQGGTTFGSGPLHELPNIRDYAIYGAAKLAKMGIKGTEWTAEMIKTFGERIRPFIGEIYNFSKQILGEYTEEERIKEAPVQQLIAQNVPIIQSEPGSMGHVLETLVSPLKTVRVLRTHFEGGKKVNREEVKIADDWLEADANRIRQSLTEYVKSELPLNERGRFISAINNATRRVPILTGDPEAMYRRAAEVAARIEDRKNEVHKNAVIDEIKATAKRAIDSPSVDIGYKARIQELLRRISWTKPTGATIESLKATRDFIARMEAQGQDVSVPRDIIDSLEMLSKVPIKEMPIEALQALADKLKFFEQLGRLKVAARQNVWNVEKSSKLSELAKEPTNPIDKRPDYPHVYGEERSYIEKIAGVLNRNINFARLLDKALLPIDALFDVLGDAKGKYRGWLFRHVRGPLDLDYNAARWLTDKLAEPIEKIMKENRMGEAQAERIGIYAIAQQEGGLERMKKMGIPLDQIQKAITTLTPAEKRVYNEMRLALDRLLPQLQKIMRDLYNIDVKPVKNYFPMPREWSKFEREVEAPKEPKFGEEMTVDELANWKTILADFIPGLTSRTEQGMTKERLPGAKTPIKINAFDVFYQHVGDVAYLLKTQRDIKMIGEMVKTDLFQKKYGKLGQNLVMNWLDTVARQNRLGGFRRIPLIDELRRRTSAGVIGFRVASQFVHLSNIPLSIQRAGASHYAAAMYEIFTPEGREFIERNFRETLARGGGEPAMVEAAESDLSVFGRTLVPKKYVRAGFAIARAIDRYNSQATVLGSYFRMLEEKGIDPRRYKEMPVDRDAQARALVFSRRAVASPLGKDVPMALSRGAITGGNITLGRSLLQFQNIFLDQWSNIRHDLWRAGIIEKNPRIASEMFLALSAMLVAETMIRTSTKEVLEQMVGYEPKKKEAVGEKMFWEAARRIPFGGMVTAWARYGEPGVPVFDAPMEVARAIRNAAVAKTTKAEYRSNIQAISGALQLLGVPGASQVGELMIKGL